jgi:protein SCO1/2
MMRTTLWTRDFGNASLHPERSANARRQGLRWWVLLLVISFLLAFCPQRSQAAETVATATPVGTREFAVKGVVKKVEPENSRVIIAHDAIPDFMDAMTMPFQVKDPAVLAAIQAGDSVSFTLSVTAEQSWIDNIVKIRALTPTTTNREPAEVTSSTTASHPPHPLLSYAFTNELGQPVRLGDFRGQVLAMTFLFTRCPIPDYCPRLSKNFEEASRKLRDIPGAPTNYHFLSVTFDPEFDTPARLKAYADRFGYDASHWSFLTGPSNQVAELARLSNMKYERDGVFFNHDLRTLIIDGSGRLRMIFPMGGNLSDAIVQEMLKAASTNKPGGKEIPSSHSSHP